MWSLICVSNSVAKQIKNNTHTRLYNSLTWRTREELGTQYKKSKAK